VFGFTIPAATTTLHNVRLVKDKETLSKLDDGNIDNICCTICQDINQPVAEVAMTLSVELLD
jgi:hypothetical protein